MIYVHLFLEGWVSIEHMGLADFLRDYNSNRVVDWLSIDVERGELGILKMMHGTHVR